MRPAYTVIWKPSVIEKTLAEIVLRATEDGTGSSAVAAASAEIDRVLSTRPAEAGESRGGAGRIMIVPPLAVVFEVREADRIVDVLRATYLPRRPSR